MPEGPGHSPGKDRGWACGTAWDVEAVLGMLPNCLEGCAAPGLFPAVGWAPGLTPQPQEMPLMVGHQAILSLGSGGREAARLSCLLPQSRCANKVLGIGPHCNSPVESRAHLKCVLGAALWRSRGRDRSMGSAVRWPWVQILHFPSVTSVSDLNPWSPNFLNC